MQRVGEWRLGPRMAARRRLAKAPSGHTSVLLSRLIYLWRFRRMPNLAEPRRFSELVQRRKLYDRDPRWPMLADKIAAKEHVADVLGREWIIPTLWHGTHLPLMPPWPRPFVLKSSHASQQCLFVRNEAEAAMWPDMRRTAQRWLRSSYGTYLGEWLYSEIPPRVLVEPFVGRGNVAPFDYKFFVFDGRVEMVQVDLDRETAHRRVMFDRDWRRLPFALEFPTDQRPIPRPATLDRMIAGAETLGRPFDFVRVDFYEVGDRPLFGEMTLYPGSGLDRFRPAHFDEYVGAYWAGKSRDGAGEWMPDKDSNLD